MYENTSGHGVQHKLDLITKKKKKKMHLTKHYNMPFLNQHVTKHEIEALTLLKTEQK
jgi:hypothetical protein